MFDHQQPGVLGFGEVGQGGGRAHPDSGQPGDVVVETHIAEVDRSHPRIQLQGVGNVGEPGRLVLHEQVLGEGPAQEGVVDPEHHIGYRIVPGQDRLVDHGACITCGQVLDGVARRGLEGLDDSVADAEGVVGDQPDRLRPRVLRCVVTASCRHHHQGDEGCPQPSHERSFRQRVSGREGRDSFLRRHYPDQVLRSETGGLPLSPSRAPCVRPP